MFTQLRAGFKTNFNSQLFQLACKQTYCISSLAGICCSLSAICTVLHSVLYSEHHYQMLVIQYCSLWRHHDYTINSLET